MEPIPQKRALTHRSFEEVIISPLIIKDRGTIVAQDMIFY